MPWRFITHQVEFDVLPDLEDRGGLRAAASARRAPRAPGSGPRAAPPPSRSAAPAAMGDRHIGGAAGPRRQREADELGLHRIGRAWSWCRRRRCRPRAPRRSRPASVGRSRMRDIGVDVDLRGDRGLRRAAPRASTAAVASFAGWRGAAASSRPSHAARAAGMRRARSAGRSAMPAPTSGPCASARVDRHRRRLDRRQVGAGRLGDAAGQRREFHRLEEADQLRPVRRLQREIVEAVGRPARRSSASPGRARSAPCRHWR